MTVDDYLASPEGERLAAQLHGHVERAIDLGALVALDQMLSVLTGDHGLDVDTSLAASEELLRRAVLEVFEMRWMGTDVPEGITEAEAFAAAFDPDCAMCVAEKAARADAATAPAEAHRHDDEPCPLCEDLAEDWRQRHADALRAAGLITS